jgi:aerobic-type carbon monoxide dehydrogenase small subunit (CoxS/CutS family)
MKDKSDSFSRRSFVKGIGAGLVGGYALVQGKEAASQERAPASPHGDMQGISLVVNGKPVRTIVRPSTTLAELIRDQLELTGTKVACNHGECGACTVLLDGKAVYSCHVLALDAAGGEVVTVEGLLDGEELHPLQQAFVDHDGFQCGFCTSGQVVAAHALLKKHPKPTREQVLKGLSGNLCRCGAYPKIIESVLGAAEKR